jgi:hypothetical protein
LNLLIVLDMSCVFFLMSIIISLQKPVSLCDTKFLLLVFPESWMAATRGISQLLRRTLHNQSSSVSIQSAYTLLYLSHRLGAEPLCYKISPCAIIIWNVSYLNGGLSSCCKQILLNIAFILAEKSGYCSVSACNTSRITVWQFLSHVLLVFTRITYIMLLYSFKMDLTVYCF